MATQAVVSLVKDGATLVKCVAGCNGWEAPALAKIIAEQHLCTVEGIHMAALALGLGCHDCLVTQDKDHVKAAEPATILGGTFYVSKFHEPTFNPRWHAGTSSYVYLVDADTWQVKAVYDISATVSLPADETVELADGYNGDTMRFYVTPLERPKDGTVKLQCAEPGQEHLFRWARIADLPVEYR